MQEGEALQIKLLENASLRRSQLKLSYKELRVHQFKSEGRISRTGRILFAKIWKQEWDWHSLRTDRKQIWKYNEWWGSAKWCWSSCKVMYKSQSRESSKKTISGQMRDKMTKVVASEMERNRKLNTYFEENKIKRLANICREW